MRQSRRAQYLLCMAHPQRIHDFLCGSMINHDAFISCVACNVILQWTYYVHARTRLPKRKTWHEPVKFVSCTFVLGVDVEKCKLSDRSYCSQSDACMYLPLSPFLEENWTITLPKRRGEAGRAKPVFRQSAPVT